MVFDAELPEGWRWAKIEDVQAPEKRATITGPFGSSIGRKFFVEKGVPVIRGNNLDVGPKKFIDDGFVYITEEKAEELSGYKAIEGDVIFTAAGTLGQVGIIPIDRKYDHYIISNKQMRVRFDRDLVDPEFAYYWFSSKPMIAYIKAIDTGSTIPLINLGILRKLPLPIPPRGEQVEIRKRLALLDEKIELNLRANQTLEQIAQALFKSWFVDFDPVRAKIAVREHFEQRTAEYGDLVPAPTTLEEAQNVAAAATIAGLTFDPTDIDGTGVLLQSKLAGMKAEQREQLLETAALFPGELTESELGEVPVGWEVASLDEIIEFNPRRSLRKGVSAPYLDMKNVPTQGHLAENVYLRDFGSGTKFTNGDTLLARITPCLENGKTAFVDFLEDEQVGWGSTEFIVLRPKGERPLSLGYLMARLESFRTLAIQSMTGTSGRQRANAKAMAMTSWLDYPINLLKRFDSIAGGYLKIAKKNGGESKVLSELRDALLPKLLSGEIQLNPESIAEAS